MTNVCVVGVGAIGSLFAAHLAQLDDVTVWAFDVSAAQVDAITRDGLELTGEARLRSTVRAHVDPAGIPPCEFGIVAVKSEYTRSALAATAGIFADAAVASVQNGIGNEEIIAEFVPRVIRGTTLAAGALTAPGVVRFDATGGTWLGPFEPKPASMAEVSALAEMLDRSGMTTRAMADARGAQWTKLVFNAAGNALGAMTGLSVGQLGDDPSLRPIVDALIDEGERVAAALGITLDSDPRAMIDDAVANAYGHRASMLQDVAARRHTEIDVLNGGIVAAGRAVGVPTPLHETMVAVIRGIERSWLGDPAHGRGSRHE
ncbi:ketopantoate reductase family protein [Lacisediminihabitans sp. FW035]